MIAPKYPISTTGRTIFSPHSFSSNFDFFIFCVGRWRTRLTCARSSARADTINMSCNSACCGLGGAASSCDLDGSSSNLRCDHVEISAILREHNARDDPEAPAGLLQAASDLRKCYLANANGELDLISIFKWRFSRLRRNEYSTSPSASYFFSVTLSSILRRPSSAS